MPVEEEETGTFHPRDQRTINVMVTGMLHDSSFLPYDPV